MLDRLQLAFEPLLPLRRPGPRDDLVRHGYRLGFRGTGMDSPMWTRPDEDEEDCDVRF